MALACKRRRVLYLDIDLSVCHSLGVHADKEVLYDASKQDERRRGGWEAGERE